MTLDELSLSLPNGFHDSRLARLSIDFARREARLELDVWVAKDLNPEGLETYQAAEVVLSGLYFWVSEPPDARYPFSLAGTETIDIGPMDRLPPERMPPLPATSPGVFVNWIFFGGWNAFVYVAAREAALNWRGDARVEVK